MADLAHLEKMGRELKCPICLGLLKSAVSLGCNHIFCNGCILESMRSVSECPVCKIPFHRREVRAAPHMDNLVSIFKNMELASGVNVLTSQVAPPMNISGTPEKGTRQVVGRKNSGTTETKVASRGKSKGKGLSGKPSKKTVTDIKSLSKKRVHVTPYPISETPQRAGKISKIEHPSNEPEDERLLQKNDMLATGEQFEPRFTPLFWLRDENEDEEALEKPSTQQTDDGSPYKATRFSDIKDSDDDPTPKGTPTSKTNVAEASDSELFEWTPRACSRELGSARLASRKLGLGEIQGNSDITNSQPAGAPGKEVPAVAPGKEVPAVAPGCDFPAVASDSVVPAVSSDIVVPAENTSNSKDNCSDGNARSRRTGFPKINVPQTKKTSNSKGRRNHVMIPLGQSGCMDVLAETQVVSGVKYRESNKESKDAEAKMPQNQGTSDDNTKRVQPKRCVRKLMKRPINKIKVGLRIDALKQFPSKFSRVIREQKQRREGVGIESLISTSTDKINDSAPIESTQTGKRIDTPRTVFQRKCKRKTVEVTDNVADIPKLPRDCNEVNDNLKDSLDKQYESDTTSFARRSRTSKRQKNSGKLKKREKNQTVVDADKIPLTSLQSDQCEKNQSETNLQSSVSLANDSLMVGGFSSVTGGNILRKCKSIQSQISCAFCQSSDDTEVSGEMMHYSSGKPVASDYNAGLNVIHAHKNCTEWAPDVYFEDDKAINLAAELARSRRIKCSCCGIKGAALGCYERSCRRSFHVTCAKLTPDCRWDKEYFVMLCPLHSSIKLPSETNKPLKLQRQRNVPKIPLDASSLCSTDALTGKWTWPSDLPCKWVLCCSALNDAEKEIISQFTRVTGVSISKTWIPTVSHIITSTDKNGACKRTLKFLMGILEGKWILNIDWIKACLEAMKPVSEEKYEITIDSHGISGGPRQGRLRLINKQPKLFSGLRFYFNGEFAPSYKGYLQNLVTAAGGTVLQRKPISRDRERLLDDPEVSETFIIYNLEVIENQKPSMDVMIHRRAEAENLADCCGAKVIGNSWIVDSIAACNLQPYLEEY